MRKFLALILLLVSSCISPVFSQTDNNGAYAFKKAGKYLERYDFYGAIPYLSHAVNLRPDNAQYCFTLGKALYEVGEVGSALPHLARASRINPFVDPKLSWYYARCLHLNMNFKEAADQYVLALRAFDPNSQEYTDIKQAIAQCNNGEAGIAAASADIMNMGEFVNSRFHEYGATFSEGYSHMIFTSRRPRKLSSLHFGLFIREDINEEVYHSYNYNGEWLKTRPFNKPIPRLTHDASISMTEDGNTLYYYVDKNWGDIYVSHRQGKKWSKRESLGSNINTQYHEPSIFITSEGQTLYFVSNKPGGKGGLDIYVSPLESENKWGTGINLGDVVNSAGDEDAPFMTPDGKHLYFSSTGHNSIGGFDIFRCDKLPDGSWSDPQNLGTPINSPGDDIFFSMSDDGKNFYFSSDRPGGLGGMDLYMGQNLKYGPPVKATMEPLVISGVVTNKMDQPVQANVKLVDALSSQVIATSPTSADGKYSFALPPSARDLELKIMVDMPNVNTTTVTGTPVTVTTTPAAGSRITLNWQFFDSGKWDIKTEKVSDLVNVSNILITNPNYHLRIVGHTDSDNSDEYNMDLSRKRANAVADYLQNLGIERHRLHVESKGESQPIYDNTNPGTKPFNRRVELFLFE